MDLHVDGYAELSGTTTNDADSEGAHEEEHVFIVRIRLEGTRAPGNTAIMRGRAEYLPTGATRYFRDLESLSRFISVKLSPDDGVG